jgi:glucose-1-phosphate cytidylyltransferase
MEVVILCGGAGTRLKEETEIKPKPMVEIGGKPILWHIMRIYSQYGFNRFILALGYKGEYIKNFFYHYRFTCNDFTISLDPNIPPRIHSFGNESKWEITCVDTGEKTLKGGRIKRLEPYIKGDDFHLTYGDGVGNVNVSELNKFHLSHHSIGTVTGVRPPSRFGEMIIEEDYVRNFEEKAQLGSGMINGGFFVFKRKLFDYLDSGEKCDFEFGPLQRLSAEGQLRVYRHDGFWQCMDNVRDRDYLEKTWEGGNAPWKIWEE